MSASILQQADAVVRKQNVHRSPPTLRSRSWFSFLWLMVQTVTQRGIGLLGQVVLARILIADDFGRSALALSLIAIINSFITFGLDDVLVQRGGAARFWRSLVASISNCAGLLAFLLVLATASMLTSALGRPDESGLLRLASIAIPFNAALTIPIATARYEMQFRVLTIANIVEAVITTVASIVLAWAHMGASSIVIAMVVASAGKLGYMSLAIGREISKQNFRMSRLMIRRGALVLLHRVLVTAIGQGDNIIVGAICGSKELGFYYFAYRIAIQPIALVAANVQAILFPLVVRMGSRPKKDKTATELCLLLNVLVFFVGAAQIVTSDLLIPLVFGESWRPAVEMVQLLSAGLGFEAATRVPGALMSAKGEFSRIVKLTAIPCPAFFALVFLGTHLRGANGAALAVSLYFIIVGPGWLLFALEGRTLHKALVVTEVYGVPSLAFLCSIVVGVYARNTLADHIHSSLSEIVIVISLSAVAYFVVSGMIVLSLPDSSISRTLLKDIITLIFKKPSP